MSLAVTSAIIPAEASLEVRMNSIPAAFRDSRYGIDGPPGIPNTYLTPAVNS